MFLFDLVGVLLCLVFVLLLVFLGRNICNCFNVSHSFFVLQVDDVNIGE